MMPMPMPTQPSSHLVPNRALPLAGTALRVDTRGGLARVVLEQRFVNPHAEPLSVTYTLPLPADGAVSGYSFKVGDRRIQGQVDRKKQARERFEEAIARGHTAALLEQDRSSLFTQELGNVPPGAEIVCEITIDQRVAWLDEGQWEWRFPLAAAPRYLGEAGRVADAARVAFDVAESVSACASLSMNIRDAVVRGRSPESPSHALQLAQEIGGFRVELGGGGKTQLDRDVVVRWPVAQAASSVQIDAARTERGEAFALVTIVPPAPDARPELVARDLVILLDTSGSMGGAPLDQARRVASALVDGLVERDTIELIEFSNSPRRFRNGALSVTREVKRDALAWIASLEASGGTEMREGILEALRPLRPDSQRQIVLVTDGLIGFEEEIISTILHRMPESSRVHTVGVGSSVNRSLTGPAARAGRGVEVVIGLGEDPERAAKRLVARTAAPIVVDLCLEGDAIALVAPARLPDLFAGAPVILAARVRAEGGTVLVRGRTARGAWEQRVRLAAPIATSNDAVAKLFAREAVEDAETSIAAGLSKAEVDPIIERLGLEHQIATRLTSWVAIDTTPSVDPTSPTRREVVPQMLPFGMSAEGLGLRAPAVVAQYRTMSSTLAGAVAGPAREAPARPRSMGRAMSPPPPAQSAPPPLEAKEDYEASRSVDLPPKPRGGLVEKAKQAFEDLKKGIASRFEPAVPEDEGALDDDIGGDLLDEASAPLGAPAPASEAAAARLRGRVVLHRFSATGTEIVFEITIEGPLDWDPALLQCVLQLLGGRTGASTVDVSRTTKKAQLFAGQIARVAITLEAAVPLEEIRSAIIVVGGEPFLVDLV